MACSPSKWKRDSCNKIPLIQYVNNFYSFYLGMSKLVTLTRFSINRRNTVPFMHHQALLHHPLCLSILSYMALSHLCLLLLATFLFMQTLADTSCTDCFVQSRAAYYPNSEENGTDGKKTDRRMAKMQT